MFLQSSASSSARRPAPPMPPRRGRGHVVGLLGLLCLLALAACSTSSGPSGPVVHVVSASRQVRAGDSAPTVATCPAGEVALSGGWEVPAAGSVLASRRMGNGWGIVVQAPAGSGVPVTASVACLAHVASATVQEVSSSVTVLSGTSAKNGARCPAGSDVAGGGFSNSNTDLYFTHFGLAIDGTGWTRTVGNSGPTAATSIVYSECLTAPGAQLTPLAASMTTIPLGSEQTITATCPEGSFASGGGFSFGTPQTMRVLSLAPASEARGWSGDLSAVGGATAVDVYVECLSFS